jgi:hypothetical protein
MRMPCASRVITYGWLGLRLRVLDHKVSIGALPHDF